MKLLMKCQPTFWQNTKPEVTPQCFKTRLPHEGKGTSRQRSGKGAIRPQKPRWEPTWNLFFNNRPGGLSVFLQNNTNMLYFIL